MKKIKFDRSTMSLRIDFERGQALFCGIYRRDIVDMLDAIRTMTETEKTAFADAIFEGKNNGRPIIRKAKKNTCRSMTLPGIDALYENERGAA